MPTPAAPYDSAAARPRPSKKPPAATTGMSTASSTVGSSSVVGTGPVWPPPSPPWIITASAPQAATFSACRAAPTDGITTMPWSLSRAISSCFGASANDATFTPCLISRSQRSCASPASARRLTPNGWSVRSLTSRIAFSSSSKRHRRAGQDAEAAGVRRTGDQARAGHPAHAGLHDRVPDAGQLGERGAEQLLDHARAPPCARSSFGSRTSRMRISSSIVGSRVSGTSPVDGELEAGRLLHLLDGHAGVHAEQPHGVVGAADVEDGRGW